MHRQPPKQGLTHRTQSHANLAHQTVGIIYERQWVYQTAKAVNGASLLVYPILLVAVLIHQPAIQKALNVPVQCLTGFAQLLRQPQNGHWLNLG